MEQNKEEDSFELVDDSYEIVSLEGFEDTAEDDSFDDQIGSKLFALDVEEAQILTDSGSYCLKLYANKRYMYTSLDMLVLITYLTVENG
uniref:Uncharacterized protein n=1 Tax=Acrobeloides nanus TaxID=290746 RepID=A0A914EK63_9BILA